MSRPAEADPCDPGFSLVEVVVAIGIVMTVLVAVLPQMIGGIRANDIARSNTQAKTLVSSELERMRNLPFQVQPDAGRGYIDLFDRYLQDTGAPSSVPDCRTGDRWVPPASTSTGYVDGTARCSYEPATGAFYRVVRRVDGYAPKGIQPDPDLRGFVVVVDTQFLNASTPPQPRAPRADYDTKAVGKDTPVTGQVGITVTVLPDRPTSQRPVTSYTQISRTYQTTTRLRARSDAIALEASTMLPGPTPEEGNAISVSGGLLHLDASLVAASRVEIAAAGTTASAATGENLGTLRTASTSPPDTVPTFSTDAAGQLTTDGCEVVCWGGGARSGSWLPRTTDGLPGIGSTRDPLEVALKNPSAGGGWALRMGSGPAALFQPALRLVNPLVRVRDAEFAFGVTESCTVSYAGTGLRLAAGGWADTKAVGADACATARTAEVQMLLYDDPDTLEIVPLVKVKLRAASARCWTDPVTGARTSIDFLVDVFYWNGSSHVLVGTYEETGTAQLPSPATLLVDGTPLSRWVDAWSVARAGAGITTTTSARVARADVPAVVSLLSTPLRNQALAPGTPRLNAADAPIVDELSAFSATIGSVSCQAEDRR